MRRLAGLTGVSESMLLALLVWLCVLFLLGQVAMPLVGLTLTAGLALALLVGLLAICWGICGYRAMNGKESRR